MLSYDTTNSQRDYSAKHPGCQVDFPGMIFRGDVPRQLCGAVAASSSSATTDIAWGWGGARGWGAALEAPSQWYLDRPTGKLYYLPLPGEDATTLDAIAPRLDCLLRFQGTKHVRVENLAFCHAEWNLPPDNPGAFQAARPRAADRHERRRHARRRPDRRARQPAGQRRRDQGQPHARILARSRPGGNRRIRSHR